MAGLSHIGIGLALKKVAPSISVGIIVLASMFLEILWILFYLVGLESVGNSFWSHSLIMAIAWSILFGIIAAIIIKNNKNGIILGIIVFSHWLLDLITHPMGAIFGKPFQAPDLPIFFGIETKLGFGLYNSSMLVSIIIELTLTIIGILIYLSTIKKKNVAMSNNS